MSSKILKCESASRHFEQEGCPKRSSPNIVKISPLLLTPLVHLSLFTSMSVSSLSRLLSRTACARPPIRSYYCGHVTSLHQSQLTWCTAPTLAMNSSSPSSSSWSASSLTSRILLEIYRYLDIQICCKTYSILPLVASKFFLKAARKCPLFPLKKIVNRNGTLSMYIFSK